MCMSFIFEICVMVIVGIGDATIQGYRVRVFLSLWLILILI